VTSPNITGPKKLAGKILLAHSPTLLWPKHCIASEFNSQLYEKENHTTQQVSCQFQVVKATLQKRYFCKSATGSRNVQQ
jgi:hypothetical protein